MHATCRFLFLKEFKFKRYKNIKDLNERTRREKISKISCTVLYCTVLYSTVLYWLLSTYNIECPIGTVELYLSRNYANFVDFLSKIWSFFFFLQKWLWNFSLFYVRSPKITSTVPVRALLCSHDFMKLWKPWNNIWNSFSALKIRKNNALLNCSQNFNLLNGDILTALYIFK